MNGSGPGRRLDGRGRIVVTCLTAVLGVLAAFGAAEAYRFWTSRWDEVLVPTAEFGRKWSADAWGPGEVLEFDVADQPGWAILFDSPEGVLPYIERAFAMWSELPTADIELRVAGVREVGPGEVPFGQDGRSRISVGNGCCGGQAPSWSETGEDGVDRVNECDIVMRYTPSWDLTEEDREELRDSFFSILLHEIGHCLGLAHAGTVSLIGRWSGDPLRPGSEFLHPRDPKMSYGFDEPEVLPADDVIGASLLRPAAGMREARGDIAGKLLLDGEPLPMTQVWALPARGDALRDRVGAFTNGDGDFLIEGLEPGDYALWAQPLYILGGIENYHDPPRDLDETVLGRLIRVEAGKTVADTDISMRQGRRVREPPPNVVATATNEGELSSITTRWGNPCAGVHVRAEKPRLALEGPRPFTRPPLPGSWSWRADGEPWFVTELTIQSTRNVYFDWAFPYRDWAWLDWAPPERYRDIYGGLSARQSHLDINISDFRITRDGPSARYSMDVAYPGTAGVALRFRSDTGNCAGEPIVVCDGERCGINP